MSPNDNTSNANNVWRVFGDGNAGNNNASNTNAVFPASSSLFVCIYGFNYL